MAFLLLVLFASVVVCQGTEKTLFFYQASNQAWHVNEDNTVLVVSNNDAFPIQHGFALARTIRPLCCPIPFCQTLILLP